MNFIYSYACYFTFERLPSEECEKVNGIFTTGEFEVDLSPTSLEFEYSGKDLARRVLGIFHELAGILGNADGELRCEIDLEEIDPQFEFFSIKHGGLFRQRAKIVRNEAIERVAL